MSPVHAVFLVHDLLFSKRGIAASTTNSLRQAVERHRVRLNGEFVKARVRRGCATIDALRPVIQKEKQAQGRGESGTFSEAFYPRWIRINNIRTTLEEQLQTTFAAYEKVDRLSKLSVGEKHHQQETQQNRYLYIDGTIPDLIAVSPAAGDFSSVPAYKEGGIILQDKASCFPAYLLLGKDDGPVGVLGDDDGDFVDGCAAPGNKTTHLASLLAKRTLPRKSRKQTKVTYRSKIYSMDASVARSKTLQQMVSIAGADKLTIILAGQDFLALDPTDERFKSVSGLLLDPSCSGSGIIGRDDVPILILPTIDGSTEAVNGTKASQSFVRGSKKRKRKEENEKSIASIENTNRASKPVKSKDDLGRLIKLSNLQTHIIEHALAFPAAKRVTYSTCSIHVIENEAVVARALASSVAKSRGWRIMRRDEQPMGLRKWPHRGIRTDRDLTPMATNEIDNKNEPDASGIVLNLSEAELDACLRCWPGDIEGTSGFFVAGFVREPSSTTNHRRKNNSASCKGDMGPLHTKEKEDEDIWEGFSD